MQQLLDIADVVKSTGVTTSTLRYYERLELIAPAGRNGLRRLYEPSIVQRLRVIGMLQRAGMTLDEVGQFLDQRRRANHGWRDMIHRKQDELQQQLSVIQAAIDGLTHTLSCPHADLLDCPHVAAALDDGGIWANTERR
ncbi:hypothetical protein AFM11_08200 [Mycolicibacterium wolinskyi]|uniref:HTH merR-type domain-containing protein n=1 Tax=Mycolicibacterium wolinskyi TaxID=59750 RepID=A0A132PQN6_9MYCO|nr:MerR family transcriptional regulator [Mycolicibacterium wolinskyi]KWX24648.1 hypothetical protein AFM11_08200 [Mycolicibacterium wolinskyi]